MLATTPAPIFTHEWESVKSLVALPPNPYVTCLQPEVHRCTNSAYISYSLFWSCLKGSNDSKRVRKAAELDAAN